MFAEMSAIRTYARPVGTFGHTTGAQVDTGVTPTGVFTLLIRPTDPLSAFIYVWDEKGDKRTSTVAVIRKVTPLFLLMILSVIWEETVQVSPMQRRFLS